MKPLRRLLPVSLSPRLAGGLLLFLLPAAARAQSAEPDTSQRRNIVSVSAAELFFKTQLGYERQVGPHSSLGISGTYQYGVHGLSKGWETSLFYRHFFKRQFPTGLYLEMQASVLNYTQEMDIVNIETSKAMFFDYRALSGGGGIGLGYRQYVLRKAFGERLMGSVLLGYRGRPRPQADYDPSIYRPAQTFVGPSGDYNWYMGFSPGSAVHGQLSLDYRF